MQQSKKQNSCGYLLKEAKQRLFQLETGSLDAEVLLAKALGKPRSYLLAYPDQNLTEAQFETYQAFVAQRAKKNPLAYVVGEKEFWSLNFKVTPDVLIPRPETELLVEKILTDYADHKDLILCDVGTGSGAIAISLAHEKPSWKIIASDVSEPALMIARENAKRNVTTSDKLTFLHSHWFDEFPKDFKADVIVSNPPYLAENDPHLMDTEISYEPRLALVARFGLHAFHCIAQQAKIFLKPGGRIYLEHGCDQAKEVASILRQLGYKKIHTINDLAQLPRLTRADNL